MGISSHTVRHDSPDPVKNAEAAALDLKTQLAGREPAQLIFFAAGCYDPARIASAVQEAFPKTITFGCSTSGEIVDGALATGTVAAMAFDAGAFDFFDITLMHRLDASGKPNDPRQQVMDAFSRFGEKLGRPVGSLEHDKYVGLAFADGIPYYIEPVLETTGDLTDVPFIGGIAGDDGKFAYTPLFFRGEMHTDAVILGLVKPAGRFCLVKTEGLEVLDRTFTVTGADEANRLVTHLDGRPAAAVYSEAIGVPEEGMDFENTFAKWPLSLMVGNEPYLRIAVERMPDSSLRFLNAVKEGMRLKLSRVADIVDTTRASMEEAKARLGSISALLHINCMSRHHELVGAGKCDAFGALFKGYPNAGFSSHGEFFIAIANQTSTMLVFA